MIDAGTHNPLRSSDAIHLAVAIRLGVDEMVTYDDELAEAAKAADLALFAPSPALGGPLRGDVPAAGSALPLS